MSALYDVLWLEGEDLRALPSTSAAPGWRPGCAQKPRPRFDLSPLVRFTDWAHLAQLREQMTSDGIEGLMLKRGDSRLSRRPAQGPVVQVEARSACWSTAC